MWQAIAEGGLECSYSQPDTPPCWEHSVELSNGCNRRWVTRASNAREVRHAEVSWIIAGIGVGAALAYVVLSEPSPQSETGWDPVENAADRTWRWGSKARVSGMGSGIVGKAKEGLGRALGDDDLTGEGVVDQAAGALKDTAGKVAHAVGETIHDLNR
jgi:uncharacterized protein YjbJ (UPF0337 family)